MNDKLMSIRSLCPITNSLDLLGDKWTLLIVRDLVLGKKQYQEFLSSPEGIATNILADRLRRLQEAGIIARQIYQHNPVRYEYILTNKGNSLKSVLKALASWGLKNFPGTRIFPSVTICK